MAHYDDFSSRSHGCLVITSNNDDNQNKFMLSDCRFNASNWVTPR